MGSTKKSIASNRKALFNYTILDTLEAGIVLTGCEVKSIRKGQINLKESYATVMSNELWLVGCHISPYFQGGVFNASPTRDRKLLLHRREINKLIGIIQQKRLTVVPLSAYWAGSLVKLKLGVAQSKKLVDKREVLKKKALDRDMERDYKQR